MLSPRFRRKFCSTLSLLPLCLLSCELTHTVKQALSVCTAHTRARAHQHASVSSREVYTTRKRIKASPGAGDGSQRSDVRVDNSELTASMAGEEQRLSTAMNAVIEDRMGGMLGQVMGQLSSMLKDTLSGGESRGVVGAPAGGGGDTAPTNISQESAAMGPTGGGGYVEGSIPQGETAASSGGGVGGAMFSGGGAGNALFSEAAKLRSFRLPK